MDEPANELSRDELLKRYKKAADRPLDDSQRRSPFKFLDSYDVADSDIFFGRDSEIEELLRLYHNTGHVLIYGESGSGKTSLIQCGLRAQIPESDALFIPVRIRSEGIPGVCHDVCQYATQTLGEAVEYDPAMTLIDALNEARVEASRPLVLFFDQFEELLIFHDADGRREFAGELAKIRKARINVKVIIGIRQDFLAQLSELEDILEGLFDHRFWLRRMSRENAANAVVKACGTCDVEIDVTLANSIVQRLDATGQGIELPYLQVVMDRLYRQAVEANPDSPVISAADVKKLGDVGQILGAFLIDEVEKLPSPDAGRQVLKAFVSQEGTRRRLTREAVAQEAAGFGGEIADKDLDAILSQLVKVRILREDVDAGLFELRHDSLAATVFSWISEVEKELIEVRDNFVNRFNEYQARSNPKSALLDQGFMDYVSVYKPRLIPLLSSIQREYLASSEQELVRQKRVKQFSIFGAIAAVILVAFLWLFNEMNNARELAKAEQEKFEEARRTVEDFFVLVSQETLLNQPGMQHLRKDLLSEAGEFFETYLRELDKKGSGITDPLLAVKARTNFYLGQLDLAKGTEDQAVEKYNEAKLTQTELADRNPDDQKLLDDLGNTLNALGNVHDDLEQFVKAKEAYDAALEKRKELVELDPDNAEYQRKYANTIMNLALFKRDDVLADATSQTEQAMAAFGPDKLGKLEGLEEAALNDPELAPESLSKLKALQEELSKLKIEALTLVEEDFISSMDDAQKIRLAGETSLLGKQEPLSGDDPETLHRIRRDLAKGYWNLGKFEQELDDAGVRRNYEGYDNATKYYQSAVEKCNMVLGMNLAIPTVTKSGDQSANAKPKDLEIQYVLVESLRELGDVHAAIPDQIVCLKNAQGIVEPLAYFSPNVIKYQGALGRVHLSLGLAYDGWATHLSGQLAAVSGDKEKTLQAEILQNREWALESFKAAQTQFEKFADDPDLKTDAETAAEKLKGAQEKLDKLKKAPKKLDEIKKTQEKA